MTAPSLHQSDTPSPFRVLDIRSLTKCYDGIPAVDDVDLYVNEGEIVGLVGENGAGKSTIMNVLSGVVGDWTGRVDLNGQSVAPRSNHEAVLLGIGRVYQESSLVPTLPIYENIFLSHEDRFRKLGIFIDHPQMVSAARDMLRHFELDLDVRREAGSFDLATRQAIEIAKACLLTELLGASKPIVLLDEPTSALTREEIQVLFEQLRMMRKRASFLFVSHRLSEVMDICDRVYVLKDGMIVAELNAAGASESELHELMVGRKRDRDYYREDQQVAVSREPLLEASRLTMSGKFAKVSLRVSPCEILGIGGVLDSGKEAVGRVLAGIDRWTKGEVVFDRNAVSARDFRSVARTSIGYVPRERDAEGIILYMSVAWNMSLASLDQVSMPLKCFLDLRKERDLVNRFIRMLGVKTVSMMAPAYQLSGGNQQKVIMAKWLSRRPELLILDNPTRGMDAGAKEDIYTLLRKLSADGMAIILITDELLELIGMSSRILIMKDGHVVAEVAAPVEKKPEERELVACMV